MNSYNELITLIDAVINRNGVQAITGQVLNGVLKAMVQQLGAGYSLSGVAHPTDDPGTPEQPVCYFASEVGTYTNFGGVGIVAGELALLCYDMTDGWFKETMYEGFASVGATIDGNVGTPSVDVTYNNGVLSFDFRNLKGNPGEDGNDGQDGAAAGFGTITASVDANVGTPSVAVTESGPDTAKNLAFAFHNLKGADGDPGVTSVNVTVDNTSGSPACAVSLNAGVLTLAFTGLKGAQGDTGSSVAYPFTIVNNLTTDDATQALSAAQGVVLDGKVTQLEAEVDGQPGSTVTEEIIRTDYTETSHTISSQNKWVGNTTGKSIIVPVSSGQVFKFQAGTNDAIVALLKTDTYSSGATPDFCDNYTSRFTPTNGQEITLPSDCHYIYILVKNSGGYIDSHEYLITSTPAVPGLKDRIDDAEEDISDIQEDITEVQGDVETLEGSVSSLQSDINGISSEIGDLSVVTDIDLSDYAQSTKMVDSNGEWQTVSGSQKYEGVTVIPGRTYKISAPEGTIFSIVAEEPQSNGTAVDFATGYSSRETLQDGGEYTFVAPSDALYIWVRVKDTSGNDVAPSIVESYSKTVVDELQKKMDTLSGLKHIYENIPVAVDADGWEVPVTPGMVNALKKAKQASTIEYDAIKTYPTNSGPTSGTIGTHKGFPYSSTKQIRKYICWEVSQKTFMTAVHNPDSLFYTENIGADYHTSGYGFDYDGTNCASYYGMVCSIFTLWCLGFAVPWETAHFKYLSKIGKLVRLANQTAQGVHICDIVWLSGHTRLVTAVQRNQYGEVTNVKITESATNVKTISYTAEQFQTYLTSHSCVLYRPTIVYENTKYTPSPFVAVFDEETPAAYDYNDDICFFAGDYAAWKLTEDCWLNYTKGDYTSVKLYKGETLLDTISLDADASTHKLDITSYISGAGDYKACLTDGVNDSDFTYWKMVDSTVTYTDNGTTQRIAFASSNGNPVWLQVCSDKGAAYCWHEITDAEAYLGYADLDLHKMIYEQSGEEGETMYVRVLFMTEYGGVVSDMVSM